LSYYETTLKNKKYFFCDKLFLSYSGDKLLNTPRIKSYCGLLAYETMKFGM